MRKKTISCVMCAFMITSIVVIEIPTDASAQVTEEWMARYDAANDLDWPNAITVGPSGNTYVTGHSYIGYDSDYATISYDPNGNELWVARYDGPAGPCYDDYGDYPYDIVVDSSENIYVTGKSRLTGCPFDNRHDFATVAYDSNGNQLWVRRYNGPGNGRDEANKMALSPNGTIVVTGNSYGIGTNLDYATIAYDLMGNQLWVARYNGPGNGEDWPDDIVIDDITGNIYVTGWSKGLNNKYDYATVAYNANGKELWVKRYDGPTSGTDEAYAIDLDSSGNIYVTGTSSGVPSYNKDFVTIAYNPSGTQLWLARTDVNDTERAHDITVDDSGRIFVTGMCQNTGSDSEFLTVSYDLSGNLLWIAGYDGSPDSQDWAKEIATVPQGFVFVVGMSNLQYPNHSDFATVIYDLDGNELRVISYNGPGSGSDSASAIIVDSYGNVYITGSSQGIGTSKDFCTFKYSIEEKILEATIDIDPNTLNLKSKGRWITGYITLNSPYDVNDIVINSILLEDTIPAEWGDIQGETLMVKFDRSKVQDMLSPGTYNLKVTGDLTDGISFEGYSDEITVIDPDKGLITRPIPRHPSGNSYIFRAKSIFPVPGTGSVITH